jgi:predicted ATPase
MRWRENAVIRRHIMVRWLLSRITGIALPTQEVAYNSVLIEQRKVLHRQTAQAIEQVFHNQLEDYDSILAHHYCKSGETEKAMNFLLQDLRTAWLTNRNRAVAME